MPLTFLDRSARSSRELSGGKGTFPEKRPIKRH